uniref:Uncharacterized protein n=1 Tax=Anguilla anguilla TaxID=7936 RepID=A0A0E9RIL4_ANGAN
MPGFYLDMSLISIQHPQISTNLNIYNVSHRILQSDLKGKIFYNSVYV